MKLCRVVGCLVGWVSYGFRKTLSNGLAYARISLHNCKAQFVISVRGHITFSNEVSFPVAIFTRVCIDFRRRGVNG